MKSPKTYRAYYFSLEGTGEKSIDEILDVIAQAGKSFHHTDQWADPDFENGPSYEELIQTAANDAASDIARLKTAIKGAADKFMQAAIASKAGGDGKGLLREGLWIIRRAAGFLDDQPIQPTSTDAS